MPHILSHLAQAGHAMRVALCTVMAGIALCAFGGTALATSVYENQPPIKDKELVSFMELLPHFRAWAVSSKEDVHPTVVDGKADFTYSDKAAEWVRVRDWDPQRFFCVMGRAAAALSIVEEGQTLNDEHPKDMPTVTQQELDLVRRHLGTLLKAGSDAPPIHR